MTRRPPRIPGMSARPRVLFVLPSIPDDAPTAFKNALAIRNACMTEGVCPDCRARGQLRGPDGHGLMHLVFAHENDCAVLLDPEAAA